MHVHVYSALSYCQYYLIYSSTAILKTTTCILSTKVFYALNVVCSFFNYLRCFVCISLCSTSARLDVFSLDLAASGLNVPLAGTVESSLR